MKTYLDCFPCFMQQALRAGRIATNDEMKIKKLLDEVGCMLSEIPIDTPPPQTGDRIYKLISSITGVNDPYQALKKKSIEEALDLYPDLRDRLEKSGDRLLMAIRIAIAGNIIDFGANSGYDLKNDLEQILEQKFAVFDYNVFKQALQSAQSILYLGDNAGESVFDRLLIEELQNPVYYVVRDKPTINDVTFDDAIASGLDKVATIISSGSSVPGTILSACSAEFKRKFQQADLIISKGQGNYEGLSNTAGKIFFMLRAKCPVIANTLGVKKDDIILKKQNHLSNSKN